MTRPARLKVENLHYDLSEDDLSVRFDLVILTGRICLAVLVLLTGYVYSMTSWDGLMVLRM
jgi:hypothetical protein